MTYGIWLSWNNQEEGFQLPINPGSIEMSDGSKGQTYDVESLGEIHVIGNPQLTTYKFSGIFPSPNSLRYSMDGSIHDPLLVAPILPSVEEEDADAGTLMKKNRYVSYLTKWMASRRPIRFIFTGDTFDINVAASIESFDWKEVAGSGGDIEYTLTLKKYVFYAARRIDTDAANRRVIGSASPRPVDRKPLQTYTLRAGDTLWQVAKLQLGDGAKWREIQRLNGITDAQVKDLPIGMVLQLPA